MKTYEALYEPNKNKGVYGISLVENPAMEGLFIALSKQEQIIHFKEVDSSQRILTGLALEPNKPVYRNQDGEEFNIVFSEATIKELAFGFLKNGYQQNSSLEHSSKITGVTFTESWIVEDENNDKANALGFKYPKGSWMVTLKVDDENIWNDFVKTGRVKGFSIDAMLSLQEINLKSETQMSEQAKTNSLLDQILTLFKGKEKEEEVKLGEQKTEDGNTTIMFEGDELKVGGKVWVVSADGMEVPLPVGEYPLDTKQVLIVAEEGIAAELKEMPAEEEVDPAAPAELAETGSESIDNQTQEAILKGIKSLLIKYEKVEGSVANLEAKVLELSNQPAAKPQKSAPEAKAPTTARERIFQDLQNK